MNDARRILIDTAAQIFRDHCTAETVNAAEHDVWPVTLWSALEETGLTLAAVPEDAGGAGGTLGDALAILRVAGRFAAPIPLAETVLAGWLLTGSGRSIPAGPLVVAPVRPADRVEARRRGGGWELSGSATRVPFAAQAAAIVTLAESPEGAVVAVVPTSAVRIEPGRNLAGELNGTVTFDGVRLADADVSPAGAGIDRDGLRLRGALTRVALMTGALERALELSTSYANERTQFGRPIGRFQAIQQQLSLVAAEVAAAGAAAEAAAEAFEAGEDWLAVAAAKIRVGEAAGTAATIAHQVHGAIGFTHEHALHQSTRRLWTWREEFGKESEWADRIGRLIAAGGAEALWPAIVGEAPVPALTSRSRPPSMTPPRQ